MRKYLDTNRLIFIILLLLGIASYFIYSQDGYNLLYADAISRLNISRKVIDNLTPGLAQLGNIWLPLPQILMIPFIWVDYFWKTGLAGAFMSIATFVLGGYFIFKASHLISNSKIVALMSLSIYALNINILYLQTTAMSESLFLCTLSATMYYLLKWFHSKDKSNLLKAAFWVSAMTLTRYEGLAVLLSSILLVFVYSFIQSKKYKTAEGNTIIYATLASFGFALWTLYLTVIFGDPLYWKNYYATAKFSEETGAAVYLQSKSFLSATWQYFTSFVWMIGLIPTVFAVLGSTTVLIKGIRNKSLEFLPALMPLSVFLFMVLTLQRNTPLVQPSLSLENILSGETSMGTGFNIRYGLLLLPWAAVVSAYLFAIKSKVLKIVFCSLFAIQVFSYFSHNYTVIYKIPAKIFKKPYGDMVEWMRTNYDGGLILISASSHEDQMFEIGIDYKNYIHEGTDKYWKESLDDPSRYAKWVVIDNGHQEDKVSQLFTRVDILEREYELLYNKEQVKIYKKKTEPYYEVY